MSEQYTLFNTVKDDIEFDALLTQGESIVEQQSGQYWTNRDESDPGTTLLQAYCYGASDLAYRHTLPLKDLLTPSVEQQKEAGIFPQEFGPQQTLTCGPISIDDYRRALLDLHSSDEGDAESYFLFQDALLIKEPETERYSYWYDKENRKYSFNKPEGIGDEGKALNLLGNYWIYLVPSRRTQQDKTLAQKILDNFLRNSRNLGESVSRIVWLQPIDFPLTMNIELDEDVADIAAVFAEVYRAAEQIVSPYPQRFTTQSLRDNGASSEQIFEGPYLLHGWIPELPAKRIYDRPLTINLSPLINTLLSIDGIKSISNLTLEDLPQHISAVENDQWSWQIEAGFYPRLWGDNPVELITSTESPLNFTIKGGINISVSKEDLEEKLTETPLIHTDPILLPWGKHRKVMDYYPAGDRLPSCYGLQTPVGAAKPEQIQLHQFMLAFEQILANGCAELEILPQLMAFKDRADVVWGVQWPFTSGSINDDVHQAYKPELATLLQRYAAVMLDNQPNQPNYSKELDILNYLLGYFGSSRAARPLTLNYVEFLLTQRGYLAQQPELAYHRDNIRIDKVSALQKRIAGRLGIGAECFKDRPDLSKLPFYVIEHRQLLPLRPNSDFDSQQTPDKVEISSDRQTLSISQTGSEGKLQRGQVVDLIVIENDPEHPFIIVSQMITSVEGNTFSISVQNSAQLEYRLTRIEDAASKNNVRWQNSNVWLEDMDYQLNYSDDQDQTVQPGQALPANQRRLVSSPQSPFPTMAKVNDKITLRYAIGPQAPQGRDVDPNYQLEATIVEVDRIKGTLVIEKIGESPDDFPDKASAWRYSWYFSSEEYANTDRFSFVVSCVINRQLIDKEGIEPYKLEAWIQEEILAEFPAHISLINHWLAADTFNNFALTYQRWQNNGAPLGDQSYSIIEILTLGRLPSDLKGIGTMRIATTEQRIEVVGDTGTEWNSDLIIENELFYVPNENE